MFEVIRACEYVSNIYWIKILLYRIFVIETNFYIGPRKWQSVHVVFSILTETTETASKERNEGTCPLINQLSVDRKRPLKFTSVYFCYICKQPCRK